MSLNDTILRRMLGCQEVSKKAANPRSKAKAKRTLLNLAYHHPEEAASLGIDAEGYMLPRVYEYGILRSDLTQATENLAQPDPMHPRTAMRLRHDYYNALCEAAKPILEQRREVISGPEQAKLHTINLEIEACFSKLRANKSYYANPPEGEQESLLAEIEQLKKDRQLLYEPARKERNVLLKEHSEETKALDKLFNAEVRRLRTIYGPKGKGLWWGNYTTVEEAIRRAYQKAKDSPDSTLHFHYQRRDGLHVSNIAEWEYWDGQGSITTLLSQENIPKTVIAALHAANKRFHLEPLTRADWQSLGGDARYFERDHSRLWLAKVRVGSTGRDPVWVKAAFVMHRPLPTDSLICGASINRRKLGNKFVERLTVTVKAPPKPQPTVGKVVTFTVKPERDGQRIKVASWTDDSGKVGTLALTDGFENSMGHVKDLQSFLDELFAQISRRLATLALPETLPTFKDGSTITFSDSPSKKELHRHSRRWSHEILTSQQRRALYAASRNALKRVKLDTRSQRENLREGINDAILIIRGEAEKLGVNGSQAELFAILLVFAERYSHLMPWVANLRDKALRRRKNDYRVFAASFGGAREFVLPNEDYRARINAQEKVLACPSELVSALQQFAQREGIKISWVKTGKPPKEWLSSGQVTTQPTAHTRGSTAARA